MLRMVQPVVGKIRENLIGKTFANGHSSVLVCGFLRFQISYILLSRNLADVDHPLQPLNVLLTAYREAESGHTQAGRVATGRFVVVEPFFVRPDPRFTLEKIG
uniref:(northern house mosquito) hypothetical protein n=1 Tax=Culex pipiens TaxID=7175 RepID=A0A8D8CME1_CULPI